MRRVLSMICVLFLIWQGCTGMTARASATDLHTAKCSASFLQNWLCRDWTEERWIQEFSEAKAAGFDALILQSVFDVVRGDCISGGHPQDADAYPSAERFCMFPSRQTADFHSSQNGGDALALAFMAAKQTNMQLWIGTVSDDLWWKFGWGVPQGSFFADWSADNAGLCADLIAEIWERYGTEYGDRIAGWYYVNEIWNMDAACGGTDGGVYARIIGENIHASVRAAAEYCPEKPVLISPFYNPDLSSSAEYTAFFSEILKTADFRTTDIYAGQDGGGKEYAAEVIREWTLAQSNAVSGRMRFWVNHECFDADFSPKPVAQLRENYNAVSDLAGGHILFSWNHYYAQDAALNGEYMAFALERTAGDVNADGVFTTADVVLLRKWLLAEPDGCIADWKAGDFSKDDRLDVSDLCLMKRELLKQ